MEESQKELALLIRRRHSGRQSVTIEATNSHVDDLNQNVMPYVPSAGGFRTFVFGREGSLLCLMCRDASPVRYKYGMFYTDLLHQEAGVIFATANLYLMTKNIGMSYRSNPGCCRFPSGVYWYAVLFDIKDEVR